MRCPGCEVLVTRIGDDKFKCHGCGNRYEGDDKGGLRILDERVSSEFSCFFSTLLLVVFLSILCLKYMRII